jgi:hypothetical protein
MICIDEDIREKNWKKLISKSSVNDIIIIIIRGVELSP